MKRAVLPAAIVATVLFASAPVEATVRSLTFEERVEAQRAIQRVYYSHMIDAHRPFAQAVPDALLEKQVRTYLEESDALARNWNTPVTASMLEAEAARIARETRFPERLEEIRAALNGDDGLLLETLVRSTLVERLVHGFYAYDERVHGAQREEAERLHGLLVGGTVDPNASYPGRMVMEEGTPSSGAGARQTRMDVAEDDGTEAVEQLRGSAPAEVGAIGDIQDGPGGYVINVTLASEPGYVKVASYRVEKTSWETWWSSHESEYDAGRVSAVADGGANALSHLGVAGAAGAVSCNQDDTWDNGALRALPDQRYGQTGVWTGTEMIIWGGEISQGVLARNGGRYDPLTDTWRFMSTDGAPDPALRSTSVWTGTEMIVWGGTGISGSGPRSGRYDPASNTWQPVSSLGAPALELEGHTAVWTGTEMIVWGGHDEQNDVVLATGARYDPASDLWRSISSNDAPQARLYHTAVWTGLQMIVWGGQALPGLPTSVLGTGARYDPATDTWTPTTQAGAPSARVEHTAVWTGSQMIVWGGVVNSASTPPVVSVTSSGARYDPVSDSWTSVTASGAPPARRAHSAVWIGDRMMIWGGSFSASPTDNGGAASGGLYDPAANRWQNVTYLNVYISTAYHTAVWTGSLVLVWGGEVGDIGLAYGSRYDPSTNTWTWMSRSADGAVLSALSPIVWTGTEMLAWSVESGQLLVYEARAGGRYDPMTDSWRPISEAGAPEGRAYHASVWTGEEMAVWGGFAAFGQYFSDGGLYNPITDSWRPMSTANGPPCRIGARAIWTGKEIIFSGGDWGCSGCASSTWAAGAVYDPATDLWRPMSGLHAPPAANRHTAVWTGHEMIQWGGQGACDRAHHCTGIVGPGARYDPSRDTWSPLPTLPSTEARVGHTAVWTGREMIVFGSSPSYTFQEPGWIYDTVTDAWRPLPVPDPAVLNVRRLNHASVWTGSKMLAWGGNSDPASPYYRVGLIFDPVAGVWNRMSSLDAPPDRRSHSAVWTGRDMLVWGGEVYEGTAEDGGRYIFGQSSDDDGDGLSECMGDCDDASPYVFPGAPETCNGRDDDCNGLVDDDADGLDTDGDGQPNACDACPSFANPGQTPNPLACMAATQDGGECLEGRVILPAPIAPGEVTLIREHPGVPDQIHVDLHVSSCLWLDPVEIRLNGQLLATFVEPQETCSCVPPVYHVTVADPSLLAALWDTTGDNEIGVVTPYAPIPYYLYGTWVTWVRARIGSGSGQPAEDVCVYDAYGGNCGVTNQCVIGSLQDVIDESVTVPASFTADDVLSTTLFSGTLPGSIDIASVPDGSMKMCVEPAGPARLYAADGAGGLYLVDPATGAASATGTLPFGVLALAHDDLTRRTWAQTNLTGSQTLAEVDLIRGGSRGQASYFGLPFSGAEMVGARLYGVEASASGARLLEVDPVTGSRHTLRTLGDGEWDGLTYDVPTGFLYAAHFLNGQSSLEILDGIDGSDVGQFPLVFRPTALEFGPNGSLYATRDTGSDTELYTLDPSTGAETFVGVLGVPGVVTLTTARNLPRACLDIVKQGERTLSTTGSCNTPPVAAASMMSPAECTSPSGATVTLDGSGSTDADSTAGTNDDIVLYEWFEGCGLGTESLLGTGERLDVMLPLGSHAVTLRVTDAAGATGTDTGSVSVVDTRGPMVTVMPSPDLLWPPNHRMVAVSPHASATDLCDPTPSLWLVSANSSESDDMSGEADGHTTDDVQGDDVGTADAEVMLRAERAGTGPGRLYTLSYAASDASGNPGTGEAVVYVPHDQGGVTEPVMLDVLAGEIRWSAAPGATTYNVLRGTVSGTHASGSFTLMEQTVCVARETQDLGVAGGAMSEDPAPGEAYTYLVEYYDGSHSGYGTARGVGEVVVVSGDSCH